VTVAGCWLLVEGKCVGGTYTAIVTPAPLFVLLGLVLGLLFGSFLNVCISRLPTHRSIVKPRSHCMACGHAIRWYDNLPVLSWVLLRARCRDCKARISWRYPAVELAVMVWFFRPSVWIWKEWTVSHVGYLPPILLLGLSPHAFVFLGAVEALNYAILGFLLIGLMVMDWQTQRLPDAFTLTGIAIGFALTCVRAIFHEPDQLPATILLDRIAAIAGAALILLLVRWGYKALRKRDGMGLGDVKLLAMIAAFLGFGQMLLALFVGVITASVYGIVLMARRRAGGSSKLPLGSFLAAGGLFAALFGPRIIAWYMELLR
jgi:leader peptidase (prepilin peptidase) / N-methyltransferase